MGRGAQEQVARLRRAVVAVIEQNRSVGYVPTYFIRETENGRALNIVEVCERLILSPQTLEWLEEALGDYPGMTTLEDQVVASADGLGLSTEAIREAGARVEYFGRIRQTGGG